MITRVVGLYVRGMDLKDGQKRSPEESPCLRHACFDCCEKTEMPLTEDDIEHLEKLGNKRGEFTVQVEGEIRLANRHGECFFLDVGRCSAYQSRPCGCRIYPLIYDERIHKFVLDPVCPYRAEFEPSRKNKDQLKRLLRRIDRETAKRLGR